MSDTENPNKVAKATGVKKDLINKDIIKYKNKKYNYAELYNLIPKLPYTCSGEHCDWFVTIVKDLETGKDAVMLAFEESCSREDWKHNFTFWDIDTKAYKGWENKLKFHKGWFTEYNSARDEIIATLNEKLAELEGEDTSKEIDIIVTGWSLGASIAPIACEDINYHFGIKPIYIGFEGGNPCGNKHTRDYVLSCINKERSVYIEFASDVVCVCPPFNWKLNKLKCHLGRVFGPIDSILHTEYYHTKTDVGIEQCLKTEV